MEKRFYHIFKSFFDEKRFFMPAILAILNAFITYFVLTTDFLQKSTLETSAYPLIVVMNSFFIILLLTLIFTHLYHLRQKPQDHMGHMPLASRFRYRIVILFIWAAFIPAIMIVLFSTLTFKKAANGWFDESVATAIYNAQEVSHTYLSEHKRNITADIFATTRDVKQNLVTPNFLLPDLVKQLEFQLLIRDLQQIVLYAHNGQVIASVYARKHDDFRKTAGQSLSLSEMLTAQKELPTTGMNISQKYMFAILPLKTGHTDYFMRIVRKINPKAIDFQNKTTKAVMTYEDLKQRKKMMEIGFFLIYTSFGLAMISFMIHAGHYFARQLTSPLERLTQTVQKIDKGEAYELVDDPLIIHDEIDDLVAAFNKMTRSLQERKSDLIRINQNLEVRRALNETVLAGISSGVIGMNEAGHIRLLNERLLDILKIDYPIGHLSEIGITFADKIFQILPQSYKMVEHECDYPCPTGGKKQLHLRIMKCSLVSQHKERQIDYVMTIDDVTQLMTAQSMAAWQDVARRIAHEIKNPLMPISLAAQRMARKWMKHIPTEEQDIFLESVQTILRQVDHIQATTNSFADFAKMPQPEFSSCLLQDILQEVIFLEQLRCPDIHYLYQSTLESPKTAMMIADQRLLSQAFINLLKNASESMKKMDADFKKAILIHLSFDGTHIMVHILDNGIGLPKDIPAYRLFDPYMTDKPEGTGLGLAITAKIFQEHQAKITLNAREFSPHHHKISGETGACVQIIFTKKEQHPLAH